MRYQRGYLDVMLAARLAVDVLLDHLCNVLLLLVIQVALQRQPLLQLNTLLGEGLDLLVQLSELGVVLLVELGNSLLDLLLHLRWRLDGFLIVDLGAFSDYC